MKFEEPINGVVLARLEDHQSMNSFESTYDDKTNIVTLTLPKGWYEGDDKTIILMENSIEAKIIIKCEMYSSKSRSIYHQESNSFLLYLVGHSISLIWSDRFRGWWIKSAGAEIV